MIWWKLINNGENSNCNNNENVLLIVIINVIMVN